MTSNYLAASLFHPFAGAFCSSWAAARICNLLQRTKSTWVPMFWWRSFSQLNSIDVTNVLIFIVARTFSIRKKENERFAFSWTATPMWNSASNHLLDLVECFALEMREFLLDLFVEKKSEAILFNRAARLFLLDDDDEGSLAVNALH